MALSGTGLGCCARRACRTSFSSIFSLLCLCGWRMRPRVILPSELTSGRRSKSFRRKRRNSFECMSYIMAYTPTFSRPSTFQRNPLSDGRWCHRAGAQPNKSVCVTPCMCVRVCVCVHTCTLGGERARRRGIPPSNFTVVYGEYSVLHSQSGGCARGARLQVRLTLIYTDTTVGLVSTHKCKSYQFICSRHDCTMNCASHRGPPEYAPAYVKR
jgi:hypothetical protein